MTLRARVLRLAGRLAITAVGLGVVALVGLQFEGIAAKNIAVADELRASRAAISTLVAREAEQRREIARLQNPLGAMPEIHDKLHLVGPNEEIIFVHGVPPTPAARRWDESQ